MSRSAGGRRLCGSGMPERHRFPLVTLTPRRPLLWIATEHGSRGISWTVSWGRWESTREPRRAKTETQTEEHGAKATADANNQP